MSRPRDYSSYLSYFRNLLRQRGKTREDAEDLIQEAFLRLEKYCREGHTVDNAEAFLTRTVFMLTVGQKRVFPGFGAL